MLYCIRNLLSLHNLFYAWRCKQSYAPNMLAVVLKFNAIGGNIFTFPYVLFDRWGFFLVLCKFLLLTDGFGIKYSCLAIISDSVGPRNYVHNSLTFLKCSVNDVCHCVNYYSCNLPHQKWIKRASTWNQCKYINIILSFRFSAITL